MLSTNKIRTQTSLKKPSATTMMSFMCYDLHTHTTCSDGSLSPSQLVELSVTQGVKHLAVTDHDTVAGIVEAEQCASGRINIIPGIEFSTLWKGINVHVIGLNLNLGSKVLQQAVQQQNAIREQRALIIDQRLQKLGIEGALMGAQKFSTGDSIGRPHFARYLVEANYVKNINQAFDKYLGAGKAGDVKHQWPSIDTAVEWIHSARGLAVLAHPQRYKLTQTKLKSLIQYFVEAKGIGIEVVSGIQEPYVTKQLNDYAHQFNLLASCGSDFHSTENGWQLPGKLSSLPSASRPIWERWEQSNTPTM